MANKNDFPFSLITRYTYKPASRDQVYPFPTPAPQPTSLPLTFTEERARVPRVCVCFRMKVCRAGVDNRKPIGAAMAWARAKTLAEV